MTELRIDPAERGFISIMVNINELKSLVRRPDHDGLILQQAHKRLRVSFQTIKALITEGHLRTRVDINPVNRGRTRYVDANAFREFELTYVTLFNFASTSKRHFRSVKTSLAERGVLPAFDPCIVHATFYRGVDLKPMP